MTWLIPDNTSLSEFLAAIEVADLELPEIGSPIESAHIDVNYDTLTTTPNQSLAELTTIVKGMIGSGNPAISLDVSALVNTLLDQLKTRYDDETEIHTRGLYVTVENVPN